LIQSQGNNLEGEGVLKKENKLSLLLNKIYEARKKHQASSQKVMTEKRRENEALLVVGEISCQNIVQITHRMGDEPRKWRVVTKIKEVEGKKRTSSITKREKRIRI